ncbi:MAG: DoxX family protein [Candidatus Absconditabacterales bacterium]
MMSSNQCCSACKSHPGHLNTGLLLMRVAVGALFIMHGLMKFGATPEMVQFIGGAAHQIGLSFLSIETWFEIVKYSEVIGGGLLILGLFPRLASAVLLIIMLTASHIKGRDIKKAELDILFAAILTSMYFTGAGRFALGALFHKSSSECSNDCCKDKANCACGDCDCCQPKK